jgi:hypothetical protein
MRRRIRGFLIVEAAAFLAAASIHFGLLFGGYGHREAGIAETVIAVVLLGGLAWTWIRPASTGRAALVVQAFALFGTLVGIWTILVGIGPRTAPDVAYHATIAAVLMAGLLVVPRAPLAGARR